MISIDRLTLPVFEAAVVGCVRSSIEGNGDNLVLSEQSHRETMALVQLSITALPLHRRNSISSSGNPLFSGWHARGALEEDERLQQLMH